MYRVSCDLPQDLMTQHGTIVPVSFPASPG